MTHRAPGACTSRVAIALRRTTAGATWLPTAGNSSMPGLLSTDGPVAALSHSDNVVTLVEGQTFCLSGPGGDILPDLPHGLFVLDTRVVSTWVLRVNGHVLEPLSATPTAPFEATFVSRGHPEPGRADADLVVLRHRSNGEGMRERVVIRNYGLDPCPVIVELVCDGDFAGLFEVKRAASNRTATVGE